MTRMTPKIIIREICVAFLLISCIPRVAVFPICGFDSSDMVSSISIDFPVLEQQTGEWSIVMNVTWPVPDHGQDGFYVKYGATGSIDSQFKCTPGDGYVFTTEAWIVFNEIYFGHDYEIRVKLYNSTNKQSALYPAKSYTTSPDCYESTGSIEFCQHQPIEYASKARETQIDYVSINQWENGTDVGVSWLPPVQINGDFHEVVFSYRPADQISYEGIDTFPMTDAEWDGNRNQRFSTTLLSLQMMTSYILNIKARVIQNGSRNFGEEVEIPFNTTVYESPLDNVTQTTTGPDVTETPAQSSSTVPTHKGGIGDAFVTVIKEEWQWLLPCALVIIFLLIATPALVIHGSRRKRTKRNVVVMS